MNKRDDFAISTADQMVEQFRQITTVTFLVMIVLSSIGLLVGGIGVLNIMLGFGDGTDARNWRAQGYWRAPLRRYSCNFYSKPLSDWD